MSKINKVVYKITIASILLVGVLNVIDCIYAASYVNATDVTLTPSVTIEPSATIKLTANTSLGVTPSKSGGSSTGGTFAKTSTPVSISIYTNTNANFSIKMRAAAKTLVSSTDTNKTIASVTGPNSYTSANFPSDRWGYSTDGTYFYEIPTSDTEIGSFQSSSAGGTGNAIPYDNVASVYFGMKVTNATPPGSYSRTLTFTVVKSS